MQTLNMKALVGTQLPVQRTHSSCRSARTQVRVHAVAAPPKLVTTRSEEVCIPEREHATACLCSPPANPPIHPPITSDPHTRS